MKCTPFPWTANTFHSSLFVLAIYVHSGRHCAIMKIDACVRGVLLFSSPHVLEGKYHQYIPESLVCMACIIYIPVPRKPCMSKKEFQIRA